ncbi:uncharacterized protein LOC142983029 [Anticarsia gemmatalis]|uniref:uncharacterized protein LOC142983029 n=1 Tax=Anticarsia gemmatalis TaxID=129554 RepID=UPI003F76E1E9
MTQEWGSLPLLPLRCILDHLSTEDALAAMSTCRHWRNAILLYEGRKETLKLRAKEMSKTLFLTRIFRKYTRTLHIYLDCSKDELEKFLNLVLPQYFDTVELRELIFIGPSYIQQNQHLPFIKLKRIITESLFFKNIHCIERFALLGCELDVAKESEKNIHKNIEYYSRGLLFNRESRNNSIMSEMNLDIHGYSFTLTHIIVDYTQISTACLLTLERLRHLRHLTLNVTNRRAWPQLDWRRVQRVYDTPLQVTVNIIAVPYRRFNDIMDNVLVEGLPLTSLKVMFCKSLYTPLLSHVSRLYQETLQELVWADNPYDSTDPYHRIVRPLRQVQRDHYAHVNPFVLLCWQCTHLRRLAIHGYWMWHYDLLGFVRLRKTLTELEISSVYNKQGQFDNEVQMSEEGTVRVMVGDSPTELDPACIDEVNEYTEFKWSPTPWRSLPAGLRARAAPAARCDYVLAEARRPPGVTLY